MIPEFTILLIDDDSVDLEHVHRATMQLPVLLKLQTAFDGREALTLLRNQQIPHPFIVLLDITMPGMDGFTFLQELRRDPVLRQTLVFVLTEHDEEPHKSFTYKEGISGYFVKSKLGGQLEKLTSFLLAYAKIVEFPA